MRGQWDAQPHDKKTPNDKKKGFSRDLHAIISEAVEKAIKQRDDEVGKRKRDEKDDDTADDNFATELENLSLSDLEEEEKEA